MAAADSPSLVFHRPVLNRAGIACANCRSKKVRCNVSDGGTPCTGCRRLGLFCSIQQSRRGRCVGHGHGDCSSSSHESPKRRKPRQPSSHGPGPARYVGKPRAPWTLHQTIQIGLTYYAVRRQTRITNNLVSITVQR